MHTFALPALDLSSEHIRYRKLSVGSRRASTEVKQVSVWTVSSFQKVLHFLMSFFFAGPLNTLSR